MLYVAVLQQKQLSPYQAFGETVESGGGGGR